MEEIALQRALWGVTWRPFGLASILGVSGPTEDLPAHDVCVIVVSNGDEGCLGSALAAVLERSGGLELDAVVVESGDDGSAEYVERNFIGVRVLRCAERGVGHACNRALETVDARYVLFLGPRMEVCEGSLADLVSAFDSRPEVALAGVRQLGGDGSPAPSSTGRFPSALHALAEALGLARAPGARRLLGERELDPRRYERTRLCEWTSELMLVRWAALESVGWFDVRLFRLAGEMDLCRRLKRAGWELAYMPHLTARRRRPLRRQAARLEAQDAYGRMQLARKHFPNLAAHYRWGLAIGYAMRVLLYSVPRRSDSARRQAARAALTTVLTGSVPLS